MTKSCIRWKQSDRKKLGRDNHQCRCGRRRQKMDLQFNLLFWLIRKMTTIYWSKDSTSRRSHGINCLLRTLQVGSKTKFDVFETVALLVSKFHADLTYGIVMILTEFPVCNDLHSFSKRESTFKKDVVLLNMANTIARSRSVLVQRTIATQCNQP